MNPYIFPECEGCVQHRYTYSYKSINIISGIRSDNSEIITKIKVEPETHYCSSEIGVYYKLTRQARPRNCIHQCREEKGK